MDIKEIAEQVSKRIYVEDGLLLSKFISEKFAEALIESYKAELLKEVVEPVYVVYNGLVMESTFIDKENAEQYARNKQKSHDLSGSLAAYRVEGRFTSDQVAAAIIKATKPLEDQLTAAQEENGRLENQVLARDAELWGRTQEILGLKEQLAAEQLNNKRLRDAHRLSIAGFKSIAAITGGVVSDLAIQSLGNIESLAQPSDTSAIDAYVAEKVKEHDSRHVPEAIK